MSKLRNIIIWGFELIGGALGTTLWMGLLAFVEYGPDHEHYPYPYGYVGVLFGISIMVLIEFAITGYLVTTLLSALLLPHKRWFLYPSVSSVLYLVHSELFFVLAGNRFFDKHNFTIQIGGACIAFALTLVGDRLRFRRLRTPGAKARFV